MNLHSETYRDEIKNRCIIKHPGSTFPNILKGNKYNFSEIEISNYLNIDKHDNNDFLIKHDAKICRCFKHDIGFKVFMCKLISNDKNINGKYIAVSTRGVKYLGENTITYKNILKDQTNE